MAAEAPSLRRGWTTGTFAAAAARAAVAIVDRSSEVLARAGA